MRISAPIFGTTVLLGISCAPLVASGQGVEVTLTPSDHNGYNISCFGSKDGTIDATVTGGTLPYEFQWSTKDSTEDVTGLPAGYYELRVMDADSVWGVADITLTEPRGIEDRDGTLPVSRGLQR